MSDLESGLVSRAAQLRRAFDHTFLAPRNLDTVPTEDFLAIRCGTESRAIRLSEISGLFVDQKITAVPGPLAVLLGVAGFRGVLVPVYDFGLLLGQAATEAPRWLVMAAAAPVAFGFDGFDGHLRISRESIVPQQEGAPLHAHVHEFARTPDGTRPVVRLASVLDAIRNQIPKAVPGKEPQA